jgi:hypothetical protein
MPTRSYRALALALIAPALYAGLPKWPCAIRSRPSAPGRTWSPCPWWCVTRSVAPSAISARKTSSSPTGQIANHHPLLRRTLRAGGIRSRQRRPARRLARSSGPDHEPRREMGKYLAGNEKVVDLRVKDESLAQPSPPRFTGRSVFEPLCGGPYKSSSVASAVMWS